MADARRIYGDGFAKMMVVNIGNGPRLDQEKQVGSILAIMRLLGALGDPPKIEVKTSRATMKVGGGFNPVSELRATLKPSDVSSIEALFAEHDADEEENSGNHPVIRALINACCAGEMVSLAVLPTEEKS